MIGGWLKLGSFCLSMVLLLLLLLRRRLGWRWRNFLFPVGEDGCCCCCWLKFFWFALLLLLLWPALLHSCIGAVRFHHRRPNGFDLFYCCFMNETRLLALVDQVMHYSIEHWARLHTGTNVLFFWGCYTFLTKCTFGPETARTAPENARKPVHDTRARLRTRTGRGTSGVKSRFSLEKVEPTKSTRP